eukprot:TRINITY_DN20893_c0_g1_i1.p1 TRINITY_DN20893_c0_g1~~TRINITY_DN20893_c0_g1_i1.p1  ORF type:complete len:298 (+),score=123.93 TRINITY_DN20893_c0_g1_i1:61-954(+)
MLGGSATWACAVLCVHWLVQCDAAYLGKKQDMSGHVIPEHSFQAPFFQDWWQGGVSHFRPYGSTVVTDSAVQLTGLQQGRLGLMNNVHSMRMEHWELKMKFRIHGKRNPGADGMALWYTEHPGNTDHPLWGQPVDFKGFGLILDTFDNNNDRTQPSITMLANLEGANRLWDSNDDFRHEAAFQCTHEYRNSLEGSPVLLRVLYRFRKLEVFLTLAGGREYFCGQLAQVDLPQGYFFGLAGKTGGHVDTHEVMSFVVTAAPGVVLDAESRLVRDLVHNPGYEQELRVRHDMEGEQRAP